MLYIYTSDPNSTSSVWVFHYFQTMQRQHQNPQVKGSVSRDCPNSDANHKSRWSLGFPTNQIQIRGSQEVPITFSSDLINLPRVGHRTQVNSYLLGYQLIIKQYNSRTAHGRDAQDQVWGRGLELPCILQRLFFLNFHWFTIPEFSDPSSFCFLSFLWRLYYICLAD